ncbi:MAG TPA: TonB-dependent receptor [Bacteroidales bacterium]
MGNRCKFLVIPFKTGIIKASLMRLFIVILALFTISFNNAIYATEFQQVAVGGTVTDLQGAPLIGVTVVVKGTTAGTLSDANGKYSISNVPQNATLIFSFVGMTSLEIPIIGRTIIDVVLAEEAVGLDEVVVVGYGTVKKHDLTGSVTRANIESFRESPNVSITQSLQGTVPGLNIGQVTTAGQDASISIRGRTTISGTTSPLIVLDGVIFRGNLVDISGNDIESIDVLKDASATAIYGSQASNGVILVTSKMGKELGKPIVSFNSSWSYQLPSYEVKLENSEEYIKKIKTMYYTTAYLAPDYVQENPNFNVSGILYGIEAVNGYNNGTDTDWWKLLTRKNGFIQDNTLSIRGKSSLSSYFFSVSYLDQANIVINDKYKRYTVRLNLENDVTKWMKLGIQSFITNSDNSGASPNIGTIQTFVPLVPAYDADNNPIHYPYKGLLNPLIEIQQDNLDKRLNIFGNFYADINMPFINGLSYRANVSQNVITTRQNNFNAADLSFQGSASKNHSYEYDWTFDNVLTYKRTFNDHSVNATLVYGIERREADSDNATAQIFLNDALGYNSLQAGQADQRLISSNAWTESSLYEMGRLNYGYKNKYLVTSTIRRDAFSGFGANNKVGYFPSIALGWIASEEGFLKDKNPWLNLLKLRLSYGVSGNRTVGRYATLAKVSSGVRYLYGDGAPAEMAQWISSLANSDLKWEKTTESNLGIDYSLFNNRLSGSIEGYIGNTSDLLYNIDIPVFNGFGTVPINIGRMRNSGVEFSINGNPILIKDFRWDISFNFSLNRNKVVSITGIDANNDGIEDNIISSNSGNSIIMGKPYGVWYDYDIIGMWQIADVPNIPAGYSAGTYKIRDISGAAGVPDGLWTAAYDRTIVGYKDPSYRFSINNSLKYQNFEFDFFINSIQGGKNYYKAVAAGNWQNIDNLKLQNSPTWDWWTPQNPNAKYRQIGDYPKSVGESVQPYSSRSFVRLQDLSLSYQFQPQFLDRLKIRTLKLYVSAKNLITWTKWEGWDPETGAGLTPGGVPVMKSYTLGINVEF